MKNILLIALFVAVLAGCDESTELSKNEPLNLIPKTTSVEVFDNAIVLGKIKKHNTGRLAQQADYSNSHLVSFEETNIKGVVTPIDENKSILNYTNDDNDLYQEQFINEIVNDNGVQKSNFYDLDGNLLFYLTIEGDDIRIYKGQSSTSNNRIFRTEGWLSTTAECVGEVANQMTDGSVVGSASFMGCLVFSGYCAAGIAVSCSIMGYALM